MITRDSELILEEVGKQIRLARLRRKISLKMVCERSGLSRTTVWNVENGSASVSIGAYAAVLKALGNLNTDLLFIAREDEQGKMMQERALLMKGRR